MTPTSTAALSARLDTHLAALRLPAAPTRYVAGALLTPTDQRHADAMAVHAVLRRASEPVDAATIDRQARLGGKRVAVAIGDLVDTGGARCVDDVRGLYAVTARVM